MMWIEIIGTVTMVLAVIGTVLNNQRRRACFYIWLVSNASSLGCHVAMGAYSFALRDAIFFGLAIHGLFAWQRPEKAKDAVTPGRRDAETSEYEAAWHRNERWRMGLGEKARFYLHTPAGRPLPSSTMNPAEAAVWMAQGDVILMR